MAQITVAASNTDLAEAQPPQRRKELLARDAGDTALRADKFKAARWLALNLHAQLNRLPDSGHQFV